MIKKALGIYIEKNSIDLVALGLRFGKAYLIAADRRAISAGQRPAEDQRERPSKGEAEEGTFGRPASGRGGKPPLPSSVQAKSIVEAIKELLSKNNIRHRAAATALPPDAVVVRYFQMPHLSREESRSAVPFEAKKYLPFKIENILSDFCLITGEKVVAPEKMGVVFVAAEKDRVSNCVGLFNNAGIKISQLEAVPFSLMRAFYFSRDVLEDETVAIVMLSPQETNINLVRNRVPYLTRNVPLIGGVAQVEGAGSMEAQGSPAFESLLSEVRLSFNYFHRQFPDEKISKIILCGEGELFKGWDKLLNSELNIDVGFRNPLLAIGGAKGCSPSFAIAAGLALRGLYPSRVQINLLPPEFRLKKEVFAKVAIAEGLAVCLVLGGIQFAISKNISELKGQLNRLKDKRPPLSVASDSVPHLEGLRRDFKERFSFLSGLVGDRVEVTTILNRLGEILPEDVWLTDFSFGEGNLTLEGLAYSEVEANNIKWVNDFVTRLKEDGEFSAKFQEVKLESVKVQVYMGYPVAAFVIKCGAK